MIGQPAWEQLLLRAANAEGLAQVHPRFTQAITLTAVSVSCTSCMDSFKPRFSVPECFCTGQLGQPASTGSRWSRLRGTVPILVQRKSVPVVLL